MQCNLYVYTSGPHDLSGSFVDWPTCYDTMGFTLCTASTSAVCILAHAIQRIVVSRATGYYRDLASRVYVQYCPLYTSWPTQSQRIFCYWHTLFRYPWLHRMYVHVTRLLYSSGLPVQWTFSQLAYVDDTWLRACTCNVAAIYTSWLCEPTDLWSTGPHIISVPQLQRFVRAINPSALCILAPTMSGIFFLPIRCDR